MDNRGTAFDRNDSFGWVSIALHWLSAIIIIAMWFIGKSILEQPADEIDARRSLHVTLGLSAWALLAARIVWRIANPHPHVRGQSRRVHRVARTAHHVMLFVLGVMLISGPLLAWAKASQRLDLAGPLQLTHATSATVLCALTVLHILGALKQLMFHDDETIVRMLWPRPNSNASSRHRPP